MISGNASRIFYPDVQASLELRPGTTLFRRCRALSLPGRHPLTHNLPARFRNFQVMHLRHSRWSHSGVWLRVFEVLEQETDNEFDSTIVRAHQHSAGTKGVPQAIGCPHSAY